MLWMELTRCCVGYLVLYFCLYKYKGVVSSLRSFWMFTSRRCRSSRHYFRLRHLRSSLNRTISFTTSCGLPHPLNRIPIPLLNERVPPLDFQSHSPHFGCQIKLYSSGYRSHLTLGADTCSSHICRAHSRSGKLADGLYKLTGRE